MYERECREMTIIFVRLAELRDHFFKLFFYVLFYNFFFQGKTNCLNRTSLWHLKSRSGHLCPIGVSKLIWKNKLINLKAKTFLKKSKKGGLIL